MYNKKWGTDHVSAGDAHHHDEGIDYGADFLFQKALILADTGLTPKPVV